MSRPSEMKSIFEIRDGRLYRIYYEEKRRLPVKTSREVAEAEKIKLRVCKLKIPK